ncbi:drug/metabolite exporter YedA [Thermomonas sp.]|uniref:drug/metabolite exporter YedA n=1 Tax=Thermomonas sp. TaxID=1971895 RepID=UPI002635C3EB|nr:drug/metabolite exporter YedA [Thermomonas sp.]MCO5055173.1 drug/metabolite exporter YedA [Thermomonas sp.]HRO62307.1 drug/metabolite exporter YedA [Thermomonas sp.]
MASSTVSPASVATAPASGVALALAALYLIWGSTYLAIRFALEGGFPPFLLGGIRFLVAGGLFYAFLRWRGVPAPRRAQWRNLLPMGFFMLLLGNGMVNLAETTVSSGLTAVAVASSALWLAIFAAIRGDRPTRLEWLGLGIGFLGVLWLNAGSSLAGSPLGLVALLVACLGWAYGSIWSRDRDLPAPFMSAAGQMLCGGALMVGVGLALGERFAQVPDARALAAFWYLVVLGSLGGFTAYIWLLSHVRPALAGSYAYVNPAIAVLLGAWLAHERFGGSELAAMGVILLGVVVITFGKALRKLVAGSDAA